MLNHEAYKRQWSKQMELSIAARDKLDGRINQAQKVKDLTLTEKVDGDYATMKEVKKVLSASFDRNGEIELH